MPGPTVPPELLQYLTGEKQDYSSVQSSIVKINAVFLSLIIFTAGLRFWVRFRMLRSSGLDDVMMIIALVFAVLLSTSSLVGERLGLGQHIWNLSPDRSKIASITGNITKTLYGAYLSYSTAITFTKFSIMATYVRIFPDGRLRKVLLILVVVILGFWISSIFAIIFTCVPVRAAWDYTIDGHCYPIVNFFYASSSLNILTDLLLCFLPVPTLWALNLPKPQKVVLCCIFCMGTFACVASILRLTHLGHVGTGFDVPYSTVSSLNWSIVEVDMGIICVCISALRPLAKHFSPNLFTSSRSNSPIYDTLTSPPGTSKVAQIQGIMSSSHSTRPPRSNSIASMRSEIYVQRTFEVSTMKELPALPKLEFPVKIMSITKAERAIVDESESESETSTIRGMEGRREKENSGREEEEEEKDEWTSRPSVVGLFTADFLEITSCEESSIGTLSRESSLDRRDAKSETIGKDHESVQ